MIKHLDLVCLYGSGALVVAVGYMLREGARMRRGYRLYCVVREPPPAPRELPPVSHEYIV